MIIKINKNKTLFKVIRKYNQNKLFYPVNFIIKYSTDYCHFELKNGIVLYFVLIFN